MLVLVLLLQAPYAPVTVGSSTRLAASQAYVSHRWLSLVFE
jgi:hypothetical protein